MNFTLRFSVFCFHSLLLITHLVHLCVVTWMLQCFWVLRWLSKEWQGAKNQNFISSMIELVFSKVIKLKRPLNFLWMAKPSFCHETPTWWLRWQIHGCPQPSPFPNHNSQVLLGHGTLLGNFLVFASTFLGESHHYIRVQQCWVTVTSGTNFTVFAPISLHFSHFPQLGWTRSTLAPLSIQALESLFRSDTCFHSFPCCCTPTLPKPHWSCCLPAPWESPSATSHIISADYWGYFMGRGWIKSVPSAQTDLRAADLLQFISLPV